MGKGDMKTRRGKIANNSFGKRRPHKLETHNKPPEAEKKSSSK
ncbi:MAG TPA: 30S ribosomal protein THX [Daejeonella sp.]|nr:30S ribosomal protein THX [Daejeonella sp.]